MGRILLSFISLLIISPVYSADDFFEKKPSILIAKDKEVQNNNISENFDFFESLKTQKIDHINQVFRRAERNKDVLFQTSNMTDYDKAQYYRENKFDNYRGYSPHIESTPNRQVISEEEYEKLMEQKRKARKVDRSLWYLLDK
ncbi:hypothetical protein IC800_08615 [Acinetobacter seifertii]|uniref:hypothetical protein n=1 Tax=Acinetobacter calcoaceticus/baumannii complex TaxID=909768 RepID=UPI001250192D|nr:MULTISPECIES: hypothetical protein [Acinetobacter calcoaceticus/baumannii complex]QNW96237.1 hypothetical protein IC800_08615 [Acinetobacter seifertii]QNX03400.1 hypothetical protein IC798_09050 [Acinetobacter seifertii]